MEILKKFVGIILIITILTAMVLGLFFGYTTEAILVIVVIRLGVTVANCFRGGKS